MHYATSNTDYACIHYAGVFTGGTKVGKLVYLAYPFETIYPSTARDTVIKDILIYFLGEENFTTAIKQSTGSNTQITIYPNPTNGVFTVTSKDLTDASIQIFDMQGRVLKEENLITNQQQVDCSTFNAGLYLVKIYGNNTLQNTARLVIFK
jgi:hypothetical protein